MSYLVFDIETIGKPYEEFSEKSKEIFQEWASRNASTDEEFERELEAVKEGLPFSPFMGEIVSIAVLDDQNNGGVYFQAPESNIEDTEEEAKTGPNEGDTTTVKYRVGSEADILERFWDVSRHYNRFVSFAGRLFDAPYLMIRSAVNQIRPTQDLMPPRYLNQQRGSQHIDLGDQLTFYGAVRRNPKLHFVTEAFGIESPKQDDIDGKEVPQAFRDKRYKEIAEYNFADVVATREVYDYWNKYINV